MAAKLISGGDLLRAFGWTPFDYREPRPETDDPAEIFRWAVRNVKVDGSNGPRSLEYYASCGIDYFSHRHEALAELIDAIAEELSAAHKSA